jgi:hypothetical protein
MIKIILTIIFAAILIYCFWKKKRVRLIIQNVTGSELKIFRTSDKKPLFFIPYNKKRIFNIVFVPRNVSISAYCGENLIAEETFSEDKNDLRWILSQENGHYSGFPTWIELS